MKRTVESLFPTLVYRAEVANAQRLNLELEDAALSLSQHDAKGRRWCEKHGYAGYTSYASIEDLAQRSKPFARLEKIIHAHAADFAKALQWNFAGAEACLRFTLGECPAAGRFAHLAPPHQCGIERHLLCDRPGRCQPHRLRGSAPCHDDGCTPAQARRL